MPHLNQAFFATGQYQLFGLVEYGVIDGTEIFDILISRVSEHGLEMGEAAQRLVALVLSLEGILEDLLNAESVKVGTLN